MDRAFNVCGVQVYESHLEPLTRRIMDVYNDSDLYMYGSTICAYLSILCYERVETEVTMFTCNDIIISHSDENESEMLKTGLRELLCHKVPDKDIVLFPVCKNSHCYLIVVLTKLYTVLCLDSLGLVRRNDLSFVMKLLKLYAKFNDQEFDENRYSFYAPDVNRQTNGYDCGVYACMFGEAIILGKNSYTVPISSNFENYRMHIKDKIMEYMDKNSTSSNEHDFDELKFMKFPFKCTINIREAVSKEITFRGDAMTYLSQIASTYWQYVECDVCANKNNPDHSHNISKQWVYCKHGNHWLHWSCVGINVTGELPNDSYTCPRCEYEQFSE